MRPVILPLLLLGLVLGRSAIAQGNQQVAVAMPFGPVYPPETWIPIDVTCLNSGDRDADGTITISTTVGPARSYSSPVRVAAKSRTKKRLLVALPDLRPSDVRGGSAPQIAWVEWRDQGSAVLARSELFARPDTLPRTASGSAAQPSLLSGRGLLILADAEQDPALAEVGIAETANAIEQSIGRPVVVSSMHPSVAPLELAAYAGLNAVVMEATNPASIPPALRETLLRFVRGGGTLLLSSTGPESDPRGSWLEPYLPVDVIGYRFVDSLRRDAAGPLPMKALLPVAEAVLRDDAVLVLGTGEHCHAAYRRLGLGRVGFIGFSPGGIRDPEQWSILARPLLNLTAMELRLAREEDRSEQAPINVLSTMVGREAPPWRVAALACLGLLAAVGVAHLVFGGPRRPWAFVVLSGLSLVFATALVGLSAAGRGRENLVLAELSVRDLGRDGGGFRQEWMTVFGADDPAMSFGVSDPEAPLQVFGAERVSLVQPPFAAPRAGARASGSGVWKSAIDESSPAIRAMLRFGPRGAELAAEQVTTPLDAPLLLINGRIFPLPPIEAAGTLPVGAANPPGQMTHFATLSTEEARLRARLAGWLSSVPTILAPFAGEVRQVPMLLGFARQDTPLITTSTPPTRRLSQSLVRMELGIAAAEVGQPVRVPGGMVRVVTDASPGLAADAAGAFRASTTGSWLVGFAPPQQIGVLSPSRAELQLDASAALHRITVRRGQVENGRVRENPEGELIAELSQTIGDRRVVFVPDAGDIDENGWVWLRLDVSQLSEISDTSRREWQISTLELTLDGKVIDLPRPPKPTWSRPGGQPR